MKVEYLKTNLWSFGYLPDNIPHAQKQKDVEKKEIKEKLNLSEIIQVDFPTDQYYRYQTEKNQIDIHHTVSPDGVMGDINWWKKTKARIATAIIIARNGDIYQCFSTKYWAHHLGVPSDFLKDLGYSDYTTRNKLLNQASIGVELDSWGGLVQHTNKKWHPARWDSKLNKMMPNLRYKAIENIVEYKEGYRGFYGYEKYTDEQIESLRQLLVYWSEVYNIPLDYNPDMWDVSKKALNGESGIWSHVSFREDKSDCHPQQELIDMLKSLI